MTEMAATMEIAAPMRRRSVFARLEEQQPDGLLGLISAFRDDRRIGKIDLGVGVYRDADGHTPVLGAVKAAEAYLLKRQDTKAYLGPEGDPVFERLLANRVLGAALAADPAVTGLQTPGGTGALTLGAALVARANPNARVWIGAPSWPNHRPLFEQAGLAVREHPFFDARTGLVDFEAMLDGLAEATAGDVILLHGCCHNPSGAGLSRAQWADLIAFVDERGLVPFVDLAYQGLGDGLDEDAHAARRILENLPEALLAYSCDKNFALYRERVGALWVRSESTPALARDNLLALARVLWSMPPDHGAAVVRIILESASLAEEWKAELGTMRRRLNNVRGALAGMHRALAPIASQRGMFAILPLSPAAVMEIRRSAGMYVAGSGRINLAGLNDANIHRFVATVAPFLDRAGSVHS